jgi:chromosome segregation ATPase
MSYSIKQVKAILANHGMPVESCTAAAEELCEAHKIDIESIKEERDTLKEKADKAEKLETELAEAKNSLAELEKAKGEYETTVAEYNKLKESITAKETRSQKETAVEGVLKTLGIGDKWYDRIKKTVDFDGIELNKDGTIKNGDKFTETIKSEWGDTIPTVTETGVKTANPPANGGKTTMTIEEIDKITDTAARQKAMLENISLYQ